MKGEVKVLTDQFMFSSSKDKEECSKSNILKFIQKSNKDINDIVLDLEFIKKFPLEFLVKNEFVPIKEINNKIYVQSYKKLTRDFKKVFKKKHNKKIIEKIITYSEYCEKITKIKEAIEIEENDYTKDFKNKKGNEILKKIIEEGIENKVSDIHFEPKEKKCKIRFRINGILKEYANLSNKTYLELLSIVKIKSNMDISLKMIPQDGSIVYKFQDKIYNCRTSTIPSIYGEKLVIRILNPNENINLECLGFKDETYKLKKVIYKNKGIFLISGPTGSGKSTTLKGIINCMNKKERNIITIEDPVEYKLKDVTQVNLNRKAGLGFKEALRSTLRQDPDVIMIGEIRDEDTAKIALRSAITGHLVLSTVHTYDSTSVITRLLDMNIPSYILLDGLSTVVSQRLLRTICPHCKEEYTLSQDTYNELGVKKGAILYKAKGCKHCNYTGYIGRQVIYEILELKDKHKNYISRHKDLTGFRNFCIENGLITLDEKCLKMLKSGDTSLEEVYKAIL